MRTLSQMPEESFTTEATKPGPASALEEELPLSVTFQFASSPPPAVNRASGGNVCGEPYMKKTALTGTTVMLYARGPRKEKK